MAMNERISTEEQSLALMLVCALLAYDPRTAVAVNGGMQHAFFFYLDSSVMHIKEHTKHGGARGGGGMRQ